jgi:hypothetical protein
LGAREQQIEGGFFLTPASIVRQSGKLSALLGRFFIGSNIADSAKLV